MENYLAGQKIPVSRLEAINFSYYSNSKSRTDTLKALDSAYTTEELKAIKRSIKPFFTQVLPARSCDPKVIKIVKQTYTSNFSPSKKNLTELLGLLFCSAGNFLVYYYWLPEPFQRVWTDMLADNGISTRQMNLRYNLRIPGLNLPASEMQSDIFPPLSFFRFELFFNSTLDFAENIGQYHLTLPASMRTLCIPFFYGRDKYKIKPVAALPADEELLVYENKQEILANLPLLMGAEQHGHIPLSLKGTVNLTTVQTARRKVEMSEFFESVIPEVANLRGALVLPLFLRYKFTGSDPDRPEKYVKRIFNNLLPMDFGWLLPVLLHHLKGLRQIERTPVMGCRQFLTVLRYLLDVPRGKWLDVDNLLVHFNYTGEDMMPFSQSYLDHKYLYFRGEVLLIDEYYTRVTVPFVKSVFFLLAAFGLADIAYGPYSVSHDCYYESLRYVRLTDLGEYILGKRKSFRPRNNRHTRRAFEACEDKLLIRSPEPDNQYEKLLLDIATPLGSSEFEVTPSSFLQTCKTPEDVQNKIDFFHQFICDEPSDVWLQFFETIAHRIKPLEEVKDNFRLFRINPENTELIKLIARDPHINKYVLKVEDYHLLIRSQDFAKVANRLKTYGYLL